jgi:hypothetical protein
VRGNAVLEQPEGDPDGEKQWRYLRKGVADTWRRAELSQQANERYLAALAAATEPTPLGTLSEPLCRRVRYHGAPIRALNPLAADDAALLAIVYRGEFVITGLRNRDVRRLLYPTVADAPTQRRRASRVTRQLRLLRGHGLLRKVSHTHRYQLTAKGRVVIAALLAAHQADTTPSRRPPNENLLRIRRNGRLALQIPQRDSVNIPPPGEPRRRQPRAVPSRLRSSR